MSSLQKGNKASSLTRITSSVSVEKSKPFFDKKLPDGKKIFKRIHGATTTVQASTVNVELVVPYNTCKITGVEIIAAVHGDKVNFKVLDTPTGTISTIPNYLLNQFGFEVFLAKDLHREISNYDADLIKDMKLVVEYIPKDTGSPREIYVNFILHEVKD